MRRKWAIRQRDRARAPARRVIALAIALGMVVSSVALALSNGTGGFRGPAPLGARQGPLSTPVAAAIGPRVLGVGPAVGAPAWHNITQRGPNSAPPGVVWGSLAYDAADQETIAFGGCTLSECPQNLTWAFSGGSWTNLTDPRDAPPARFSDVMTYDPNMHGVLLFGGAGISGYLSDTWLFSGGVWTNLSYVGPAPTARAFSTLAFDPAPEENGSVLFGGYNVGIGVLNDTWIWQGWSGWVRLIGSVHPPATDAASMAYDPTGSAMVLYGAGFTSSTWELYSGQWWNVNLVGPPYRDGSSMVYDPALGSVILFGGANGSLILNDLWEFSSGSWISVSFGTPPSGRAFAGLTLDPSGSVPFLFGGSNGYNHANDTWVIATVPTASLNAPASVEVTESATFTAQVASGTPPYTATIHFGDNALAIVTGSGPALAANHAYGQPGSYLPSVDVTDSAGMNASAGATRAVVVTAGPAIEASASLSAVDVGKSVSFSANATSPGTPPVKYSWQFGDGANSTGATVVHAYSSAGAFPVQVTGTDANGLEANASLSVVVRPLPTLTTGSNRSSATAGDPVTFYANLSGGVTPYEYAWNFGDGNRSGFPSPFHVFTVAGNYTVTVWTNDSFSVTNHESLHVAIKAAPAGKTVPPPANNTTVTATASSGIPAWFYPGLVGIAAAGAVGAALLVGWARSRRT